MLYCVNRAVQSPSPEDAWSSTVWSAAETLEVASFHPNSSTHRPRTSVRVLYDDAHLFVHFSVHDRFVRCVHTTYQDRVSRDSCVEIFLQPDPERGYFNFEFNCGGTLLLYYIEDPARTETAPFRKFTAVPESIGQSVRVHTSLPRRVEPEITEPIEWTLSAAIPFTVFAPWLGSVAPDIAGRRWRGNFFKCGDETSHPHWASWNPIGEILRFHQPDRFGLLEFRH